MQARPGSGWGAQVDLKQNLWRQKPGPRKRLFDLMLQRAVLLDQRPPGLGIFRAERGGRQVKAIMRIDGVDPDVALMEFDELNAQLQVRIDRAAEPKFVAGRSALELGKVLTHTGGDWAGRQPGL